MLDRLWWTQEAVQSNERKEITQEQMSDFLDSMNKSKETIKKCKYEESLDRKQEEKELKLCEDFFDWNEDIENFESRLQELKQQAKESPAKDGTDKAGNQYETQKETETLSEKEKVIKYAQISELAYWEYETTDNWEVQLTKVNLDPLSFPNLKNLTNTPPDKLTPEEKVLYTFIQENKDNYNLNTQVDNNISDILKLAWYDTSINTISSTETNISEWLLESIREQQLIIAWLTKVKKQKTNETNESLQQLKQDFKISDYYPKWQDRDESWFQALILEDKQWNKHISICWTKIEWLDTDLRDVWEDVIMLNNFLPIRQSIDLIKFIERNTKDWPEWEKIKIMWHSLWWALSQIATAMYSWQVEEAYTFNSPWTRNLEVYIQMIEKELSRDNTLSESDKELIIAKFQIFWYNEDSNKIAYDKENNPGSELITNVSWTKWLSPIANLWEDIWDYSIELKELASHWIKDLIDYVDRLRENSEELKKKYIERKVKKKDKKLKE